MDDLDFDPLEDSNLAQELTITDSEPAREVDDIKLRTSSNNSIIDSDLEKPWIPDFDPQT